MEMIDQGDARDGALKNVEYSSDEDRDFVTIESDDDIQIAFQEWREAQKHHYHTGQLGEIELFCLSVDN